MRSLADATALVTGAGSGIGRAVAQRLAEQGARLALVSRNAERLAHVAHELDATAFAADLGDPAELESLAGRVEAHFGDAPEILINAAGRFALVPVAETAALAFDEMLAVNLRAPFVLIRAFLPRMLARASGHILSIGSNAGRLALAGNGAYSASKFGLRGLHEVLAVELKGSGVRTTLIEPAATDTGLWQGIDRSRYADVPARAQMLDVAAVADCVLFALTVPAEGSINYLAIERP